MNRNYRTFIEYPPASWVFAFSFVALTLVNIRHLMDPPYWDGIFVYSQAIWLKNHHFNLLELARQPGYFDGGPSINPMYAIALLAGVLYKFFSTAVVFLIMHLLNIAWAAFAVTVFYALLRETLKPSLALLWCAAAGSQPIWSGQSAAIYLEIPLAACVGAIILLVYQKKYAAAAIVCVLTYFIKQSVLLFGMAIWAYVTAVVLVENVLFRKSVRERTPRSVFLLLLPLPLYLVLEKVRASNMSTQLYFQLIATNLQYLWEGCPDLVVLSMFALALFLLLLFKKRKSIFSNSSLKRNVYLTALMLIFIFGYWCSFILYLNPLYRYATFAVFPLFATISLLLFELAPKVSGHFCLFLLLFNLYNQYGVVLPPPHEREARSGEKLERSREYLLDLQGTRKFCSDLEERFGDKNIVAKYPFIQMLTLPELGYVDRALPHLFAVNRHPLYTPSKFANLGLLGNSETAFLYAPNVFESSLIPSLKPDPKDCTILSNTIRNGTLILYERAEIGWLDPGKHPRRAKSWADVFFIHGNILLGRGSLKEALTCFEGTLALDSQYGDAHNNLGVVHYKLNQPDRATHHFHQALEINPDNVEARRNLELIAGMQD